ncbi:nucleoside 2-deoxyribosyltransferase [Acidovorax cavernicola]|uniref:Nucleoside 2-deoxyribosyltransferase n=1 Tax=Acidovorax cavernicola TaxID=1675792 RepID=A0A9X8D8Z3_9BURK|nr:nucleoside 2-deoxyribosyltransferase [Acidovorax cavernicola]RIX85027.1 nucleoside 2-deoxyribosyltransferase [Acidovorax cavernicola]
MPSSSSRPRVYLAGPDVFRPDAAQYFAALALACDALGMTAVPPFDGKDAGTDPARRIYEENMKLLRSADGVIANLAPFRGLEPDSGTVFEVGAAIALGLPVAAYGVPPGTYAQRAGTAGLVGRDPDGTLRDPDGTLIEDFGLPLNLMLACSVHFSDLATDALRVLAGILGSAPEKRR